MRAASTEDVISRHRMSAAGLRTWLNIARGWEITDQQAAVLLGTAYSTYRRWKRNPDTMTLDANQLERLSLLLGIYKALQVLLPREDAADSWIRRPNQAFGGQRPLDRLLAGQVGDLLAVRQYLDAERGW